MKSDFSGQADVNGVWLDEVALEDNYRCALFEDFGQFLYSFTNIMHITAKTKHVLSVQARPPGQQGTWREIRLTRRSYACSHYAWGTRQRNDSNRYQDT